MSDTEQVESPDLKTLINELYSVRQKWHPIGIQLSLDSSILEDIDTKHSGDVSRQFCCMLQEWLKNGPQTSWSEIVAALRSPSVAAYKLARNLERNKCPVRYNDDSIADSSLDIYQDEHLPSAAAEPQIMMPNHTFEEVPPNVREGIKCLAKSFNKLRIKTFCHVSRLGEDNKISPDYLRYIVCNTERCWAADDHKHICSATSIPKMLAIVSVRRYLNWQNFDLLEEIIEVTGDSELKKELNSYCEEIKSFESETPLSDVKNIIFTPLCHNRYLMKVPVPSEINDKRLNIARCVHDGLKKNGYSSSIHHVEENSPLAIFFIVPRLLVPPTAFLKLSAENIEDRVICTLSEEDVLQLMDQQQPSAPRNILTQPRLPPIIPDSARTDKTESASLQMPVTGLTQSEDFEEILVPADALTVQSYLSYSFTKHTATPRSSKIKKVANGRHNSKVKRKKLFPSAKPHIFPRRGKVHRHSCH